MGQEELSWRPEALVELEQLGHAFLADVYSIETNRHPENLDALVDLGHLYTQLARYDEGLAVDRELVRREPENETYRYNLACSLALVGEADAAIATLAEAVTLGYSDPEHLETDEDLASLRAIAGFQELVRRLRAAPPAADDA